MSKQAYADIVLPLLMNNPMSTFTIMQVDIGKNAGSILRPGAVIEDIRHGNSITGRPKADVKMTPVGKSGMALYYLTQSEKQRLKKLGVIPHGTR